MRLIREYVYLLEAIRICPQPASVLHKRNPVTCIEAMQSPRLDPYLRFKRLVPGQHSDTVGVAVLIYSNVSLARVLFES
jgi:hypothetical protein